MTSTQTLPNSNHEEEEEADLLALQLANSSVLPMAFQAAIELQVLEIIGKAGSGAYLSPKEIASQLPTQNPEAPAMLDRILRALACHSVLTSTVVTQENGLVESKYGLTPVSKCFVSNQDGASFSPLLLLVQDKVFMDSWYHLKDAVLEGGIPFNLAHGMHAFQYPRIDLRFNDVFNRAMSNITTMVMKRILEIYKGFESLKELVDVGGGVGTSLSMITAKYPKIKGINFDLPHVIERAPSFPGVKHVGGDMFTSVAKGEAIFMKLILHDWSDEHCLKLLKNCYHALPSNGKLIVVDAILPVTPENNSSTKCVYQSDLIMMTQNPGGRERTEKEFEAMALAIGFAGIRKICCVSNKWVMEFFK